MKDRIKKVRIKSGLTQQDLADILGVSLSMIKQIERGTKFPSSILIMYIADYFGVTTDYLLGRE